MSKKNNGNNRNNRNNSNNGNNGNNSDNEFGLWLSTEPKGTNITKEKYLSLKKAGMLPLPIPSYNESEQQAATTALRVAEQQQALRVAEKEEDKAEEDWDSWNTPWNGPDTENNKRRRDENINRQKSATQKRAIQKKKV